MRRYRVALVKPSQTIKRYRTNEFPGAERACSSSGISFHEHESFSEAEGMVRAVMTG